MSTDNLEYIVRDEGFAVVCMPGESKPSLVLKAEALTELLPLWRAASARAKSLHPDVLAGAVSDLCSSLERIFKVYERQSMDWWAMQPPPPELTEALAELEAAQKILEGSDFDPDDGPRRS